MNAFGSAVTPHPKLPGTIFTAAEEINKAGGRGLPIECDIRSEESVQKAVEKTVKEFGGIDIVINNGEFGNFFDRMYGDLVADVASAISLTTTQETPLKKYDLMNTINSRGKISILFELQYNSHHGVMSRHLAGIQGSAN